MTTPKRLRTAAALVLAAAIGALLATAADTATGAFQAVDPPPATAGEFSPPWPQYDWTAADIQAGAPMRAAHVRDLRNAADHLLSRILQSGSRPTSCGATIARYLAGSPSIHDYIENNLVPRDQWTEQNLTIYRQQIAEEDRIRQDCLGHPRP